MAEQHRTVAARSAADVASERRAAVVVPLRPGTPAPARPDPEAELAEAVRLHRADAAAFRRLLAEEQARVAALHASTSWRLTAPLRALGGLRRGRVAKPAAIAWPLPGDIATHPALSPASLPTARVSVVLPTRDAGAEFGFLLRKLQAQRGVDLDIVVIDSGSGDGTPELAASLGCRVLPIAAAAFSHSAARNLGAAHATGEFLLFMVQDAYPVGEDWIAGLVRALRDPRHRLAAVSCVETSRSDSDLLYDCLARAHYAFLGCAGGDRIGARTTLDHEGLRTQGQLSDVACLIPRALFERYRFEGRYAEDLTLGIRLLRDGHRLAMLSSLRVVHSHNRPAGYYLRRLFVDVTFLAGVFPDHGAPRCNAVRGTLAMHAALVAALPTIRADLTSTPAAAIGAAMEAAEAVSPDRYAGVPAVGAFGLAPFAAWLAQWEAGPLGPDDRRAGRQLRGMFVDRLRGLRHAVEPAWPVLDETAAAQVAGLLNQALAITLGAQLAYCRLDPAPGTPAERLADLATLLEAGI